MYNDNSLFKKYQKLFKLPTPTQLNMSDNDYAMGMRGFHSAGQKTWEDYEEELESLHPVKYFFAHKLPEFFERKIWWSITRPLETARYWFVSHFVPSRRFHMLDLRQPKNDSYEKYRWGYIDPTQKVVYAMMNILNDFIENELPQLHIPTEEDTDFSSHRKAYLTMKEVYHYWNVQRKLDLKEEANLLTRWHNARQVGDPNTERYSKELGEKESYNESTLNDMLKKILDVRGHMWS